MAVPTKDSALATFAPNFSTIVSAAPATYNVLPAQAAALATASGNFTTAYNAARKDQSGPACAPVSTYLQFGSVSMAA